MQAIQPDRAPKRFWRSNTILALLFSILIIPMQGLATYITGNIFHNLLLLGCIIPICHFFVALLSGFCVGSAARGEENAFNKNIGIGLLTGLFSGLLSIISGLLFW